MPLGRLRGRTTLIGALMVKNGDADAMLCGTIANFDIHLRYINEVIGLRRKCGPLCHDECSDSSRPDNFCVRHLREHQSRMRRRSRTLRYSGCRGGQTVRCSSPMSRCCRILISERQRIASAQKKMSLAREIIIKQRSLR